MKIESLLTWQDMQETPELLEKFSEGAEQRLRGRALKAKDESVYMLGRGSSDNATIFAKYVWEKYAGVRTDFIRPHSVFEAKKPLTFRKKVVWAYSQSGKSTDIIECLKKLQSWGAAGVAVTNEPDLKNNPLARAARHHILLSESKERGVAATKTFALQLWLGLWTAQVWSGCFSGAQFGNCVKLLRQYLRRPNAGCDKERFGYWKDLAEAPVVAFVGRGTLSAVAADAALKFRELAEVHAASYSAAEFLHGPLGAHGPKDLVLLLSPSKDKLPQDLRQVSDALKARGTVHRVIAPFGGTAPFNALLTDIELKIAALRLGLEKGLEPDRPRLLNKVTPTI